MAELHLENRVILLTGASRGIGRAIVRKLARHGVRLVLVARTSAALEEAAREAESCGGEVLPLSVDLLEATAPEVISEALKARYGKLDVLINNAGTAFTEAFERTDAQQWDRVMRLNAMAPFFLTQAVLPLLRNSDAPTVVNISSVVGAKGYAGQAAYSASKHALAGWTKAAARELQAEDIRFHLLAPGGVATELAAEMRPDLDPAILIDTEEIAELVEFLVTHRGRGTVDEINIRRSSSTPWP